MSDLKLGFSPCQQEEEGGGGSLDLAVSTNGNFSSGPTRSLFFMDLVCVATRVPVLRAHLEKRCVPVPVGAAHLYYLSLNLKNRVHRSSSAPVCFGSSG